MKILILLLAVIVLSNDARADDSWDTQIRSVIQGHERLKAAVANTEGSIEIRATNSAGKLQPYIVGDFFRGDSSFRADFSAWNPKTLESGLGLRQLIAIDRKHSYQIRGSSVDTMTAILHVRDASYLDVKLLVDSAFNFNIDSLWCVSGRPITDIMQQPNSSFEISDSDGISDALIITVSDAGAEVRYILDPSHDYACRRAVLETEIGMGADVSIEVATTPGGKFFPSELHERGFDGVGEYRKETRLVLSSLKKPLPVEFSDDSFLDFGVDYTISRDDQVPQGTFFGADRSNSSAPSSRSSAYFWIIAASLVAVGIALVYRAWRKR